MDIGGTITFGETVRAAVEASPALDLEGHVVRYTVSIGAAQARDTDVRDTTLIGRADEALDEAKQAGRNCVRGEHPQQGKLPILEGTL
ncbi:MAG: diguanylate cyclase [Coriobacteriia bacterium]|nr:diguanylate cyclase [Coriobacteriia bacterium]